jgi:hypothetical protein
VRPWSVDDATLYALTGRAWERRGTPHFDAAVSAILEAYDRSPLAWLERCERRRIRNLALIELLRETDPEPWWQAAA